MIKRYPRSICYRYAYGTDASDTCTWVEDCTAKLEAIATATAAVEAAQTAYDNAKALDDSLKAEQKGIQECMDAYDNNYNMLANAGMTFLTEQNVNCLNEGAKCLQDYYNAVSEAKIAAAAERKACVEALRQAKSDLRAAEAMSCDKKCV